VHLFYEIFLPYIIFLHPRLRSKCCCDSNQHRCSCPMYPGEEVTLQERSLRKRSHQHVSLTRIISGWWCDITTAFAFRSDSRNFVRAYYARTHTRTWRWIFAPLSVRRNARTVKALIYLVEGAADLCALDTRSTCVRVYSSAYMDGVCMDEWEPIPSQRVRTILIVNVGDVRSYEKELENTRERPRFA